MVKAHTRDEFMDMIIKEIIKKREHIDEETYILEQKKGDAVVSLLPDVREDIV